MKLEITPSGALVDQPVRTVLSELADQRTRIQSGANDFRVRIGYGRSNLQLNFGVRRGGHR